MVRGKRASLVRLGLLVTTLVMTVVGGLMGAAVHAQAQAQAQPAVTATKSWALSVDVDGGGVPSPGDTLRYTVRITNTGAEALEGVVFTDTPSNPLALVIGSVTTTKGTVDSGNAPGDTRVVVTVGRLEPGETVTIEFEMRVCACATDVREVRNQGTVITPGGDVPTDDPATPDAPNDETVTPIEPQERPRPGPITKEAELAVDADNSGSVTPGDVLRYTIVVPNAGRLPLTGVIVEDPLGEGLELVAGSVRVSHGGRVLEGDAPDDRRVRVIIPTIPPGEAAVVVLEARVLPGVLFVRNQGFVEVPGVPLPTPLPPPGAPPGPPFAPAPPAPRPGMIPTDDPTTPDVVGDETVTPVEPVALPENRPPQAICVADVIDAQAGLVRFLDRSVDPDGTIVERVWDFDDGTRCPPDCSAPEAGRAGTPEQPFHQFQHPTRTLFVVTLTVTDDAGNTATARCRVIVGDPHPLRVLDANGNGVIDTPEFFRALDFWVSGAPLPGTEYQEQRTIDDALFLRILDLWVSGAPIETVLGLGLRLSPQGAGTGAATTDAGRAIELRVRMGSRALLVGAQGAGALSIAGLRLELYDLSGRTVARARSAGPRLRLALPERLPNGVYLYRVVAQDARGGLKERVGKVVVQRVVQR